MAFNSGFKGLRSTWLGRKFATNTAMKQAVTSCLQTHDTNFFYTRYKPWCHDRTNAKMSMVNTWKSGV